MAGLATVVRRHVAPAFHPPPAPHSSGGSDDGGSAPSPGTSTPPPSPSGPPRGDSKGSGAGGLLETPTRKNKRKLSEPRKRASDFSIKRLCPDSPSGGSAMSESGCSDDGGEADSRVRPPPPPRHGKKAQRRVLNDDLDESSPSRGPSERGTPVATGNSNGHPSGGAPPHPFFPAGLPFMPGFYLTDGRTGFPPPPFPALPLGLPHPGFAGTVAEPQREDPRGHGQHGGASSRSSRGTSHAGQAQDLSRTADSPDPDNLSDDDSPHGSGSGGRKPRKNYKNMTRERRVEANARERTRVHTISAAFEALRRAVPSYSYNQKLSKLAILRIACTYIMSLARLADVDVSNITEPVIPHTFADCVDLCTRTIQTEGRARRRH